MIQAQEKGDKEKDMHTKRKIYTVTRIVRNIKKEKRERKKKGRHRGREKNRYRQRKIKLVSFHSR